MTTDTFNGSFFGQDINLLDGTNDNFNLCIEVAPTQHILNEGGHISDPLEVIDSAILGFNVQELHGFWNKLDVSHLESPPVESSFTGYITNRLTNIRDGGKVVVGDYNGLTTANVEVCKGTVLRLGENNSNDLPSVIVINDNSTLTIGEGAILEIWDNYEIILNGANAVLEIKGTVKIMEGGIFTVSQGSLGLGFVRVVKNYIPSSQAFVSDNNQPCEIRLVGVDQTQKLLEIRGTDGLYIGLPAKVHIENCAIEMEKGSKFNPEVNELEMFYVDVIKYGTYTGHRGILIPGYTQTRFTDVDIVDGVEGIHLYKSGYQKSKIFSLLNITHCNIGILSRGVDFNCTRTNITGYSICGIAGTTLNGSSAFDRLNVSLSSQSNSISGFKHLGSGNLYFNKSVFNNNYIGIETMDGVFSLKCTEITNSYEIGFNGEMYSKLRMHGNSYGYNLFEDNPNQILMRYDGQWIIKGGHNVFKGPNSVVKFWVSMGWNVPYVDDLNGFMYGNDNYFHGAGSSPWRVQTPASELEAKNVPGMEMNFHDHGSGTLGNYLTDIANNCPDQTPPWMPGEGPVGYEEDKHGEVIQEITTGLFGTGDIVEQLGMVVDSANVQNPNYDFTLTGYCQILNFNYIDTPSRALQGLLMDIYSDKMSVYQRSMSEYDDTSTYDPAIINAQMLACNAGLISKANSNKFPWSLMKYELYRDRAAIYRFDNNYDSAYVALDSCAAKNSAFANKVAYVGYLNCLYHGEEAVIDTLVAPDSVDIYYPCIYEPVSPAPDQIVRNKSINKTKYQFILFPNPTDEFVYISGNRLDKVNIHNAIGKLVGDYDSNGVKSNEVIMDVSQLPAGIYIVTLYSGNLVENHRLVKR